MAALAVTLADWKKHGAAYAQAMCDTAACARAQALQRAGPAGVCERQGATSHQFAVEAARWGWRQTAGPNAWARAGLLACGIGLPIAAVEGDVNGLRLGVPGSCGWA